MACMWRRRPCFSMSSYFYCVAWWWILTTYAFGMISMVSSLPSNNEKSGAAGDNNVVLHCPIGWGYSSKQSNQLQPIRQSQIDDGYCDCPLSGEDEPNTEACSGRDFWPGTALQHPPIEPHLFACPQQPKLQLPMSRLHDGICDCCDGSDENMAIVTTGTSSRAPSSSAACPDQCEQMLAADRAARKLLVQSYRSGSAQRQQQVHSFQLLKQQTIELIETTKSNLRVVKEALSKIRSYTHHIKRTNLMKLLAQIRAKTLAAPLIGLVQSLDATTELYWFIVHACQLAGEMEGSTGKTCIPLRLAGLDAAMLWEHQTYNVTYVNYNPIPGDDDMNVDPSTQTAAILMQLRQQQLLAGLLDFNLHQTGNTNGKIWNAEGLHRQQKIGGYDSNHNHPSAKPVAEEQQGDIRNRKGRRHERHRRRLSAIDDGDEDDLHEDDEARYNEDDDMTADDEDENNEHSEGEKYLSSDQTEQDSTGNIDATSGSKSRDDLSEMLLRRSFSKSRSSFLIRAETIISAINNITQENEKEGDVEPDHLPEDEKTDTASNSAPSSLDDAKSVPNHFDPMLLPVIRNKVEQRQRSIRRGLDYGMSAKVLLDAVQQAFNNPGTLSGITSLHETMYALAIGTLNHGQLSAWHYWQLLAHVLPELAPMAAVMNENGDVSSTSETCGASWTLTAPLLCPPRTVQRSAVQGATTIPQAAIVSAVESYCREHEAALLLTTTTATFDAACKSDQEPKFLNNASAIIPLDVPDGFAGYLPPTPRVGTDLLDQLFIGLKWGYDTEIQGQLDKLQNETSRLEQQETDLQNQLNLMEDLLAGDEAGRYGPDGELYTLKDTCHSITTGKYTYEMCLFGSARQKEGEGAVGTDLGKWTEALVDVDDEGNGTGDRIWKWENGAKCWNGPHRSATVHVKCGAGNKVLSADEPETCKYVFVMESYVACDEIFQKRHEL